jgi:hypothetical protein
MSFFIDQMHLAADLPAWPENTTQVAKYHAKVKTQKAYFKKYGWQLVSALGYPAGQMRFTLKSLKNPDFVIEIGSEISPGQPGKPGWTLHLSSKKYKATQTVLSKGNPALKAQTFDSWLAYYIKDHAAAALLTREMEQERLRQRMQKEQERDRKKQEERQREEEDYRKRQIQQEQEEAAYRAQNPVVELKEQMEHLLSGLSVGPGGRLTHVRFEDGQYPLWEATPTNRKRLDHYVGTFDHRSKNDDDYDPEGWNEEAWEEEYAGPVYAIVTKALAQQFGQGMFDVEVGDKGFVTVQPRRPLREKYKFAALLSRITMAQVKAALQKDSWHWAWQSWEIELRGAKFADGAVSIKQFRNKSAKKMWFEALWYTGIPSRRWQSEKFDDLAPAVAYLNAHQEEAILNVENETDGRTAGLKPRAYPLGTRVREKRRPEITGSVAYLRTFNAQGRPYRTTFYESEGQGYIYVLRDDGEAQGYLPEELEFESRRVACFINDPNTIPAPGERITGVALEIENGTLVPGGMHVLRTENGSELMFHLDTRKDQGMNPTARVAKRWLDRQGYDDQSADDVYQHRSRQISEHLKSLSVLLRRHAAEQKRKPQDWGFPGDLNYVESNLREIVTFLKNEG